MEKTVIVKDQAVPAAPAREEAPTPSVKPYDFKHPKLVSKEIMRALRSIHDLLSRNLSRIFTDTLNQKIDVSLEDIDEIIFSEFLSGLEPPAGLFLFNIEELGDWAVMEMDASLCLYLIERQSGSPADAMHTPRTLTRIEERIISRTINKIFKELSHVWSSYLSITILNHVYESKPANIRTISSHVPGIVVRFTLRVKDSVLPLRLCYPYALLKEQMNNSFHKPEKHAGKQILSPVQKRAFENYMKSVAVPVQAVLGRAAISMHELGRLQEGDVIKLNQSIDEPLEVLVNGTPKMIGYPGLMRGKKAVKIFEVSKSLKPNQDYL